MNETLKLSGKVKVVLKDSTGNIKLSIDQPNIITTVGKELIASLIADAAVTTVSHMAIGSGNTAPAITDTTLVTELGRVALTSTTAVGNQVIYLATFGPGVATGSVNEAGLFNDGTVGDMQCRTLFSTTIPKGSGDSLEVTWTLTVS